MKKLVAVNAALKGKRTYLIALLLILVELLQLVGGDVTWFEAMNDIPDILQALGLITLRAGIAGHFKQAAS